ncbi:MAG TPA: hypothetical protein VLJ15_01165 [Gammaproteobacteria bacterium]|nr:hypothetical protein [Gammaproteobacteria bacterium]
MDARTTASEIQLTEINSWVDAIKVFKEIKAEGSDAHFLINELLPGHQERLKKHVSQVEADRMLLTWFWFKDNGNSKAKKIAEETTRTVIIPSLLEKGLYLNKSKETTSNPLPSPDKKKSSEEEWKKVVASLQASTKSNLDHEYLKSNFMKERLAESPVAELTVKTLEWLHKNGNPPAKRLAGVELIKIRKQTEKKDEKPKTKTQTAPRPATNGSLEIKTTTGVPITWSEKLGIFKIMTETGRDTHFLTAVFLPQSKSILAKQPTPADIQEILETLYFFKNKGTSDAIEIADAAILEFLPLIAKPTPDESYTDPLTDNDLLAYFDQLVKNEKDVDYLNGDDLNSLLKLQDVPDEIIETLNWFSDHGTLEAKKIVSKKFDEMAKLQIAIMNATLDSSEHKNEAPLFNLTLGDKEAEEYLNEAMPSCSVKPAPALTKKQMRKIRKDEMIKKNQEKTDATPINEAELDATIAAIEEQKKIRAAQRAEEQAKAEAAKAAAIAEGRAKSAKNNRKKQESPLSGKMPNTKKNDDEWESAYKKMIREETERLKKEKAREKEARKQAQQALESEEARKASEKAAEERKRQKAVDLLLARKAEEEAEEDRATAIAKKSQPELAALSVLAEEKTSSKKSGDVSFLEINPLIVPRFYSLFFTKLRELTGDPNIYVGGSVSLTFYLNTIHPERHLKPDDYDVYLFDQDQDALLAKLEAEKIASSTPGRPKQDGDILECTRIPSKNYPIIELLVRDGQHKRKIDLAIWYKNENENETTHEALIRKRNECGNFPAFGAFYDERTPNEIFGSSEVIDHISNKRLGTYAHRDLESVFMEDVRRLLQLVMKKDCYHLSGFRVDAPLEAALNQGLPEKCFRQLWTDKSQQTKLSTFFGKTLFARYTIIDGIELLNQHYNMYQAMTGTTYTPSYETTRSLEPFNQSDNYGRRLAFFGFVSEAFYKSIRHHGYPGALNYIKTWHFYGTTQKLIMPDDLVYLENIKTKILIGAPEMNGKSSTMLSPILPSPQARTMELKESKKTRSLRERKEADASAAAEKLAVVIAGRFGTTDPYRPLAWLNTPAPVVPSDTNAQAYNEVLPLPPAPSGFNPFKAK